MRLGQWSGKLILTAGRRDNNSKPKRNFGLGENGNEQLRWITINIKFKKIGEKI